MNCTANLEIRSFQCRIFTSNVMQAISIRRVEILALKKFQHFAQFISTFAFKTNFLFVM